MEPAELVALEQNGRVARELVAGTIIRQIFSPNQLYELMVDFWSNHFSIHAFAPPEVFLKGADDREVIRKHALGHFPEMLKASARSPAMLVYLDNFQSQYPDPNENYARELLELHSLGVDGGYTYQDIQNVARAFTGWSINGFRRRGGEPGRFVYLANWHDPEPKQVMGHELPGGQADGERVLEILANHPSTAIYVSEKLVGRFVADVPPESLIDNVANTYIETGGSIRDMLRTIFYSDEFAHSAGMKLKRPLDFVVSLLRITGADGRLERVLEPYLRALGQGPFGWPAPDGYPDTAPAWSSTTQSLYRWNMALSVTSGLVRGLSTKLEGFDEANIEVELDRLSIQLIGQPLPDMERGILMDFARGAELPTDVALGGVMAGLVLCTTQFQMR